MVRSRWAMRTLGSRPAVGRRQIVADKSSKRDITSAHQRSRPSSLPLSILSPPSLLRFASPRSLLCLFLPFFAPFSPVPRFLPFPSDASSSSTGSLAARGESGTMIYGLGASFHLLSIRAARSREPGPSLRRPTWPIFRAGFAGVYTSRGRPVHACRSLARSTASPLACLLAGLLACLLACLLVVREK